jgi:hypothetical protein
LNQKSKDEEEEGERSPPERKGTRAEAAFLKSNNIKENLPENFWVSMQIAHYNMAVELEHLKMFPESVESFEKAKQVSRIHLNDRNTALLNDINSNISDIENKMQS